MTDKVLAYIKQYHMISEGDRIVVGVSGGADSVCLLLMLLEIRKSLPIELYVVHVHHGIRGAEADEDAVFVKQLCEINDISFYLFWEQVPEYAKQHALSIEEAGRKLRYEAFEQVKETCHASKIAVAHHKDDQAETVLFHLFRGSGLKGLGGMKPVRGDIIRPLLCLERSEIESFLQEREQTYRTDATNEETTYTRNIIRHEVIAVAKAQIQEQVVVHIADTAMRMQQAEQFVEQYAKKEYGNVVTVQEDVYRIHVKALSDIDPFIQTYIIRMCMEQLAEKWKDIAAGHVKDVLDLAAKDVGKSISLPQNMTARRDYEDILIYKKDVDTDKVTVCENVTVPGTIYLENDVCIDFQVEACENKGDIVQKKYTKWFDYDKIESDLLLRNRKTNDFMCINSNMDRQTIKTYCINEKIPKEERDQLLLLADGSHILWLIGYRISEQYKVTKETKNILKVRVYGGTCDE